MHELSLCRLLGLVLQESGSIRDPRFINPIGAPESLWGFCEAVKGLFTHGAQTRGVRRYRARGQGSGKTEVGVALEPVAGGRVGRRLSTLVLFLGCGLLCSFRSGCSPVFVPTATCTVGRVPK